MSDLLSIGLSGLTSSRIRALSSANNLANVNTTGFRSQRANTASVNGGGAQVSSTSANPSGGALRQTGNPTDLAIGGSGFFEVADGEGNTTFSRDGAFRVGADGTLVNSQGLELQPPVNIPAEANSITVGEDGTVNAGFADGTTQELGQIQLADFSNPQGLAAQGGNQFAQTGASGIAQRSAPGQNGTGRVLSGFLETSNVDIAREMINLGTEQNLTQANAAVIRTADQMQKSVIDILG